MDSELQETTKQLKNLLLRRSKVSSELANIDSEIASTINERDRRPNRPSTNTKEVKYKKDKKKSQVKDSRGVVLEVGDKVETVTRGLYHDRKAEIIAINYKDNSVTIRYLQIKKQTWRKAHNVTKLSV